MNTVNLDDMTFLERIDPGEMGKRISELGDQCEAASSLVEECPLPDDYRNADGIVILGLGGSAIGGDLVSSLVRDECPVPIFVNRDYDLPAFVCDQTLVVASSYSGKTEETLTGFRQALDRGAKVVAITTGGELASLCQREGLPQITFDYQSQPRAALGYSFMTLLSLLEELGYVSDKSAQLEEAVTSLQRLGAQIGIQVPEANNPAKQLARRLEGKVPVIYGAAHLSQVARRWKCQFNENSKNWSFWDVLPELNHNTVCGYEFPRSPTPEMHVLMLASDLYHPRHRVRLEVTGKILDRQGITHETLHIGGERPLSQMLWAIHLGDYVTYYLAALNGVDPTPVKAISYLKERLSEIQ